MATAKTGTFYLTENVDLTAASPALTRFQTSVDLSAYVNVPTGQAIAIDQVDFIWQQTDVVSGSIDYAVRTMLGANGSLSAQLTDQNPGTTFIRADDQSLIASGSMQIDISQSIATHANDLYPDNFGPGSLSESFMVVNDTLYLVAGNDAGAIGANQVHCSVRIRCRVVKLSTKDWMAIAIQSTASDN